MRHLRLRCRRAKPRNARTILRMKMTRSPSFATHLVYAGRSSCPTAVEPLLNRRIFFSYYITQFNGLKCGSYLDFIIGAEYGMHCGGRGIEITQRNYEKISFLHLFRCPLKPSITFSLKPAWKFR